MLPAIFKVLINGNVIIKMNVRWSAFLMLQAARNSLATFANALLLFLTAALTVSSLTFGTNLYSLFLKQLLLFKRLPKLYFTG